MSLGNLQQQRPQLYPRPPQLDSSSLLLKSVPISNGSSLLDESEAASVLLSYQSNDATKIYFSNPTEYINERDIKMLILKLLLRAYVY